LAPSRWLLSLSLYVETSAKIESSLHEHTHARIKPHTHTHMQKDTMVLTQVTPNICLFSFLLKFYL
jgi:hypothetical protein